MSEFDVTYSFIANTRARAGQVNQNITDVMNIFKDHHHDPNVYTGAVPITNSGIAANAQILDTQLYSQITRSGLINQTALTPITNPGIIALSAVPNLNVNFGDGSDGNITLDGTNTYSFLSKSGSTYTATRNIYASSITIESGSTLVMTGYRLFVSNTIDGAGTLDWGTPNNGSNGTDSSGGTPGTGGSGGAQSGSGPLKNTAGGAGTDGADFGQAGIDASAGTSHDPGIGVDGAAGGNGGSGESGDPGQGGAAGTVTDPDIKFGNSRMNAVEMHQFSSGTLEEIFGTAGSGGGGGGAGTGVNSSYTPGGGGGAGASGGIIWVAARIWAGTFTIKSIGGDGGDGGDSIGTVTNSVNGGGGGGAGGSGGVSMFIYGTKTWTGSYNVAGGTGGSGGISQTGGGTGVSGSNGGTGTYYEIQNFTLV